MSISCEVILRWEATPAQCKALGAALWGWVNRAAGERSVYQHLDNQALADLLAGRQPVAVPAARDGGLPYVVFLVRGDADQEGADMRASLRRTLPTGGVADVRVGGVSWRLPEPQGPTSAAPPA